MRRVVHVVCTLGAEGGMEQTLLRTMRGLHERGYEQKVALLTDRTEILDIAPYAELVRIAPRRPRDPTVVLRLRQLITRFRPHVVHSRNWGAWPDVAVARLTVRKRPALLFSYHGVEDTGAPSAARKLAFNALARSTARILAVADAAADRLAEQFAYDRSKIEILRDGIDTDRFVPREGARRPGPFVIGTVGRLMNIKNLPLLLKAVARASEKRPTLKLRLAGDGYLKEELQKLGDELGLGERLELLGYTKDVPAFLQGLDLYVQSSDLEANPNALIEALACGLPAVATDVGGTCEVADHGNAARLVPRRDEVAMAAAIDELLTDRDERARLSQNGRAHAVNVYGLKAMVDAYDALYQNPRRR